MCACAAPRCEFRVLDRITPDLAHPPKPGRGGLEAGLPERVEPLAAPARAESLREPTPDGQQKNAACRQPPGTVRGVDTGGSQAPARGRNRKGGGESGC